MALLKKKVILVRHKITLEIEKSLVERMAKIEKLAADNGFEFDLESGLVDSLVMQVARAETVIQKALRGENEAP